MDIKPIRIELPDGTKYKGRPFTVENYRDLLLIRHQNSQYTAENMQQLDDLLEDLFPEIAPEFRPFIFLKIFCDSSGVDTLAIKIKCGNCGDERVRRVQVGQPRKLEYKKHTIIDDENIKIVLSHKYLHSDDIKVDDLNFLETVNKIILDVEILNKETNEIETYKWDELDEELKDYFYDLISYEKFMEIIQNLFPVNRAPFVGEISCCDNPTGFDDLIFNNFFELFGFILNPEEIMYYYKSNHILVTEGGYNILDIMNMAPMEKSIALKLTEETVSKRSKQYGNSK